MKSKSRGSETGPADQGVSARGKEIGGKRFRVGSGDTYVPFRSRTRRRRRAAVAAALGVVVLGAGVYGVVTLVSPPTPVTAAAACPTGTARAVGAAAEAQALPSPGQITVNVYNSTSRNGLAASTAAVLKERGFTVGKVTNDPLKANLTVPAQVRGGTAGAEDMKVIAAEVSGAQLQSDGRADNSVDLVLGAGFTALSAPDQVAALLHPPATASAAAHAGCSGTN